LESDADEMKCRTGENFTDSQLMAFFRLGVKGKVPDSRQPAPSSRNFRIYKFRSRNTGRLRNILKCDFEDCNQHFSKFHNFYDHLRKHTGERPFECPFKEKYGCPKKFTQKSNLTKHAAKHEGKGKKYKYPKTKKKSATKK
jgi:uncharacterized Zn-finger protein